MNHETKEQAASNYLQKFERTDAYSPRHMEKAFIAGATWREQQAASGFEEYEKEYWDREAIGGKTYREWMRQDYVEMATSYQRIAWQASQLSSAKLLAEKDAEIERLKEILDTINKRGEE